MFTRKEGRRTIGATLKEKYFGLNADCTFSSYYPKRGQITESDSCGGWLVAGMVGYLLCNKVSCSSFHRGNVFDLLMVLIEDLDLPTKRKKAHECFGITHVTGSKRTALDSPLLSPIKSRRIVGFEDQSTFTSSTPEKSDTRNTTFVKERLNSRLSDFEMSSFETPEKIPDLSGITDVEETTGKNDTAISFSKREESDEMSVTVESAVDSSRGSGVNSVTFESDIDGPDENSAAAFDSFVRESPAEAKAEDFISGNGVGARAVGGHGMTSKKFLSANDIFLLLNNRDDKPKVELIPNEIKENVYFLVSEKRNMMRSEIGQTKQYPDDCGAWNDGRTVNSYFIKGDNNGMKSITMKNGAFCTEKRSEVYTLSRYYIELIRCNTYKRRISRLIRPNCNQSDDISVIEYTGEYPVKLASHGNALHHDTAYVRTNPKVLEKITSMVDTRTPRDVYKSMVFNDSINAPKDFKQVRNIKYRQQKKHGIQEGVKGNLADEILECLSMVDSCDFVRDLGKTKGKMPNIVCYTENQKKDLQFFLSQKSGNAIGVNRTFNLGVFYVTALVYKNLRVVRKDNENEHPLCIGVFIHRDAKFPAYNYFFVTIKSSLCSEYSVESFEIRLGKDMIIGSDEEQTLMNAIASHFPASEHFLCTKHLKDGTRAYMQTKVGVPQKDRKIITKQIFGEDGIVNADDTAEFDARSKKILKDIVKYPKFATYFQKKLKPTVENFVSDPARRSKSTTTWTNNNCESLNHIMKLDADWKVQTTPALINMVHEMTQLYFKDLKRSLYGEGNYRLYGKYNKYLINLVI